MKGYIYAIKENNNIIYIGCTNNFIRRRNDHFHCNRKDEKKMQPIQKYIKEKKIIESNMIILLEKDFCDIKEMYKFESYYIEKYKTFDIGLNYNRGGTSCGDGLKNPNTRRIICNTTGEVFNCIKDACCKYGLINTEMSSHLNRTRYKNGIGKKKNGYNLLFTYLDIEKDNRIISKETKEKIRKNNIKNCKKIKDLNSNKTFNSLKEASEYFGISKGYLSSIINDKVKSDKYSFINLEYINK